MCGICLRCSSEYEVRSGHQRYCSELCRRRAHKTRQSKTPNGRAAKQRRNKNAHERRKKERPPKLCANCSRQIVNGGYKFCSPDCLRVSAMQRAKRLRAEARPWLDCLMCGEKFHSKHRNQLYCSKTCSNRRFRASAYGLEVKAVAALWRAHDGTCDACGGLIEEGRHALDHCHKTGVARGILHSSCNSALGLMGESREVALSLADYLARHVSSNT